MDQKFGEYARVSDIIYKQTESSMRTIPIDNLVYASIRGTQIHNYCTCYLKKLFMPEIEEEYLPYVEAFIAWVDEKVEKLVSPPARLYDHKKMFTGEFDGIVKLKDVEGNILIDIKTSDQKSSSWVVQQAAYKHLCDINNIEVSTCYTIHLHKMAKKKEENDSSPPRIKLKEIDNAENLSLGWDIFTSALKCYDYFDRPPKKERKKKDV